MTAKIIARDPLDEIRRAFALFDSDKTGKIRYVQEMLCVLQVLTVYSYANLQRVAQELGENLDDDELRAMIDEFDLDQDGESMCFYCFLLSLESIANKNLVS